MTTSQADSTNATSSLKQDWLNAIRYWLGGRNGLIIAALAIAVAGLALNWSWLVAAGIAPLLLGALPCVVMCGLGLCMNRMTGGSCSSGNKDAAGPASEPAPPAAQTEARLAATDADNVERRGPSHEGD